MNKPTIQNKDLYTTSQSATSAYYEARSKNKTYKTIVGWLFDEVSEEELQEYLDKTATEFVLCIAELCKDIANIFPVLAKDSHALDDEIKEIEEKMNQKTKEELCETCRHGIKVDYKTYRCRRGWNIIVHSCKECDEYERRDEK